MSEIVSFEESGGIVTITMDDSKANALSTKMVGDLGAAFDRCDAGTKAVVLVGREGKFSAGFDLKEMMAGPESAGALVTFGGELLTRLYEFPAPLVVACTGHALAGGALLAATGDTRIGALGEFKIGLNEVQNGLPVPILAHAFARDCLLTTEFYAATVQAKIYNPETAVAAGWLDRAVAPGEVVASAQAEAERLAKLPKVAYVATKRSVRKQTVDHIRATLEENIREMLSPKS